MSRKQRERRDAAAATKATQSKLVRRLVPVLLALAGLALGVNIYWWIYRPKLEPLPVVDSETLEPPVKALIQKAIAEVSANDFSPIAWGDLGATLRAHDLAAPAEVCYRNAERLDESDGWKELASGEYPVPSRITLRRGAEIYVQLRR